MREFIRWQDEHRYAAIDRLENMIVSTGFDSFSPSTFYDGRAYSVEKQKKCYLAAFFPFYKVEDWAKLYKGDMKDEATGTITRHCPVGIMRKFIEGVDGGILQGVERNSIHGVMNGEHVNLSEYAKSMLERHEKVGDLNSVLQAFQVLRAFCYVKMNGCRAANTFDNIMLTLQEFKIAHPVTEDEYPKGTQIGNVTSARKMAFRSTERERWTPFFVVSSIGKSELVDIVKTVSKKIWKDFKDVNLRDFCNEKQLICDEVDKVTGGTGHMELAHIRMAAGKDGDLKKNLDKIVADFEAKSRQKARATHKVNMLDDLSSLAGNVGEECAALRQTRQSGNQPDNNTLINNQYIIIDAAFGAIYRKLNRPNLSSTEIQLCKRIKGKTFRLASNPAARSTNFKQKSKRIFNKAITGAKKVRGERQNRYRAFLIDENDG